MFFVFVSGKWRTFKIMLKQCLSIAVSTYNMCSVEYYGNYCFKTCIAMSLSGDHEESYF